MNRQTALVYSRERIREIEDVAARWGLPDATWAEILARTPDGDWTQAFELKAGRARPLTDIVWVPAPLN